MLIHLIPRMYACRINEPCSLVDLTCPDFGLALRADKELTARRPYPNKNYLVACRKQGQKAMNGILIETPGPVQEFTIITRWAVAASDVVTHRVRYVVLDNDYDAITEDMTLWYASHDGYESRWPEHPSYGSPVMNQPTMEVWPRMQRRAESFDEMSMSKNLLKERTEIFRLHTVQRERITDVNVSHDQRLPKIDHTFKAIFN